MNAFPERSILSLLTLILVMTSQPAAATLFGVGDNVKGLPAIVLEAEYDFYGETGTLSKLRGRHLRPPYSLPVSSVAIVDNLNAELDRRNRKSAPKVVVKDRLRWGRFEIFSVIKPLGNGQEISIPTPVICKSKYECRVDTAFEDRLSKEQRALLAWTRFYLLKNNSKRRLNNQQSARVTNDYKMFSIYDDLAESSPAINFWLNMPLLKKSDSIELASGSPPPRTGRPEINAITSFISALQNLPESELNEESFEFNNLMGKHLQTLFAGQYTYPFTRTSTNSSNRVEYSREDMSALELARELRSWHRIKPMAYIKGAKVRYLLVSINDSLNNLHMLPVRCKENGLCDSLHWEQLRSTETRLLNYPFLLSQFSQYLKGF